MSKDAKALVISNATPSGIISGFHNAADYESVASIVRELFTGILEESKVKLLANHSKEFTPVKEDDTFLIALWSHIKGHKVLKKIEGGMLYGFTGIYKEAIFEPSGTGIPVVSPEGVVVAEYFPDEKNLVFLFDSSHVQREYPDTLNVLQAVLEEFINVYYERADGVKYTKEELAERRAQARKEQRMKNIVTMLDKLASVRVKTLSDSIKADEQRLVEVKAEVIRLAKGLVHNETQLRALSASSEEARAKMMEEFNRIQDIKGITNFEIEGQKLAFYTDMIYMPVNGNLYRAGKYKILVNPENSEVRFTNLTEENRRLSVWGAKCHHPHVDESGRGCLGNVADSLVQLIIQNEWCGLAMMLLAYLESVNTGDSAGKHYPNWDMVDKDGNVLRKGLNMPNPSSTVECRQCGRQINLDRDSHAVCDECHGVFCKEHYVYSDDLNMKFCKTCFEKKVVKCAASGKEVLKVNAKKVGDKYYHPDFVPSKKEEKKEQTGNCPICGEPADPNKLLTCEICGTQGCEKCIQLGALNNGNTGWGCAEHRR